MTQATFDRKIARLKRTEERCRELQDKLDAVQRQWNQRIEELRSSEKAATPTRQMWFAYCEQAAITPHYDFGDMIC